MLLYIDETENNDFFIVAGLLVPSISVIELAYKHFKKSISNQKLSDKSKSLIYTEFKSTLIDKDYHHIKEQMLNEISKMSPSILYSCHEKKSPKLNQIQKEAVYITLLSNILEVLNDKTEVIFDRFGLTSFEKTIMRSASTNSNVLSIKPHDSQEIHGLQLVDNICSVLRLYKSNEDIHNYYALIEKYVKEI